MGYQTTPQFILAIGQAKKNRADIFYRDQQYFIAERNRQTVILPWTTRAFIDGPTLNDQITQTGAEENEEVPINEAVDQNVHMPKREQHDSAVTSKELGETGESDQLVEIIRKGNGAYDCGELKQKGEQVPEITDDEPNEGSVMEEQLGDGEQIAIMIVTDGDVDATTLADRLIEAVEGKLREEAE